MHRIIINLIAPILPALIPLILLAACASTPGQEASEAYEAACNGNFAEATEAADKAYAHLDKLNNTDLCNLAAAYAAIAVTNGDLDAADRFEVVYTSSLAKDPEGSAKFYSSLEPEMSTGLKLLSGLLAGQGIYATTPVSHKSYVSYPIVDSTQTIADEALAED